MVRQSKIAGYVFAMIHWPFVHSLFPMTDVNPLARVALEISHRSKLTANINGTMIGSVESQIYPELITWSRNTRKDGLDSCQESFITLARDLVNADKSAEQGL